MRCTIMCLRSWRPTLVSGSLTPLIIGSHPSGFLRVHADSPPRVRQLYLKDWGRDTLAVGDIDLPSGTTAPLCSSGDLAIFGVGGPPPRCPRAYITSRHDARGFFARVRGIAYVAVTQSAGSPLVVRLSQRYRLRCVRSS